MIRRLAHKSHRSFAILSLTVASCSLWAQEDDPALRVRFLQGVAQTAAKLENLSFREKAIYVGSAKRNGIPDDIDTRNFEMGIRGAYGLETGVNKDTRNVFFRGRNDKYAFSLERTSDGVRTSLQFVEQIGIDPSVDARIAAMEETPRAIALAGYYLWTEPLSKVVESDAFTITRAYDMPSGAEELIRVEFEYIFEDAARKRKHRFTDGFLVCDPAKEWVLTEYGGTNYNLINKSTKVLTVVLECAETIGGMPIATKVTQTDSSLDGNYKGESILTMEITDRNVPEEEFYLSHYGLPEPNFERSWLGTWGWYLIGGIGCIVVGAITIRWRNTRR
jgi:hypothetical protein